MTHAEEFPDANAPAERELGILAGKERPTTELQAQMLLAEELYRRDHPGELLDLEDRRTRNDIMFHWGSSGFSRAFRDLLRSAEFQNDPRLRGDFLNITLTDLDRHRVRP